MPTVPSACSVLEGRRERNGGAWRRCPPVNVVPSGKCVFMMEVTGGTGRGSPLHVAMWSLKEGFPGRWRCRLSGGEQQSVMS